MRRSADTAASIAGVILRIGHGSECRLWIPETVSGRNPDLAIVFRGTPKDSGVGARPTWPSRSSRRARGPRARLRDQAGDYLAFGLREYGSSIPIDGRSPCWSARMGPRRQAGPSMSFRGDEMIVSPLLEGFAARVTELWADAELDPEDDGIRDVERR